VSASVGAVPDYTRPVRPPLSRDVSVGAVVLAVTLPIVFLHVNYQPSFGVGPATVKLSDVMVLLTALAAVAAVRTRGLAPLRPGLPIWVAAALFLLWIAAATLYPSHPYPFRTHAVTAGEFAEYALLAPAVPLLVRRRAEAVLALGTLVVWSVAATLVGVLQWCGWEIAAGWGQAQREPSFLGTQDFAAFSGMVLLLGVTALLWGARDGLRRTAWVGVVSGAVGFAVGGATSGVIGLVPAAAIALYVASRRGRLRRASLVAAVAATAVASLGVVVYRSGDYGQFFSFLGVRHESASATTNVQTYPQHTLLAYIGLRIWQRHPVVGAGFEASNDYATYGPELAAAHARFPHVAPASFPTKAHSFGVQDLYVQTLADLGLIGLALLAALYAAGIVPALLAALRAPPEAAFPALLGAAWLVLSLGLWTAQGIIAGIPLDALTWLGFGAAATRTVSWTD
jgi:O-Antigen ligase